LAIKPEAGREFANRHYARGGVLGRSGMTCDSRCAKIRLVV
jgi:hypothetical protein